MSEVAELKKLNDSLHTLSVKGFIFSKENYIITNYHVVKNPVLYLLSL